EETDAVVIVVSEETGAISVASSGKMTRELDAGSLRRLLGGIFLKENREGAPVFQRLKDLFPARDK
ncbi:MAG TPA: DNA integrity scanning protein DisA nucleotide-binding domain protein, partial [Nitrospiria bacterium]|nr:DNA integrity scanning protein DisA nucleotide-binding domain protein [Nitrospiria bacterium]